MRFPTRAPLLLLGFLPAAAALGQPGILRAQGSASLEIAVLTVAEGLPVSGAQVLVEGVDAGRATDPRGFLRLRDLPAGTWLVEVRFIGYVPWQRHVTLEAGQAGGLLVHLEADPVVLEALEVHARSTLLSRGFYDRKRSGVGTFLTRDDLDAMRPRVLSDVLRRVGGIHVGSDSRGMPPARIRGQQTIAGACPIQYFVDGVLTYAMNIDEVRPGDVEGIEIYRGAASIPIMFRRGSASCGVIVLWTRVQ
jgi:TonB-dependent starch-binding outer membrane protein SusC